MDGSKHIAQERRPFTPENSSDAEATISSPERKRMTEAQIEAWLSEQLTDPKSEMEVFGKTAREDFARIETTNNLTIDRPTNNRLLALLNRAEQSYATFKNRVETIRQNYTEKKALSKLFGELERSASTDPVHTIKTWSESLERIKTFAAQNPEFPFNRWERLGDNLIDTYNSEIQKYLKVIEGQPNYLENLSEVYQTLSGMGPESVLKPSQFKNALVDSTYELRTKIHAQLSQKFPSKPDSIQYLKDHDLDDLLLAFAETPEERSEVLNTCVEKKIGRQSVLVGEHRGIIPHLQSLDASTLSEQAKHQIFSDLISTSRGETTLRNSWGACIFYRQELFIKEIQRAAPEVLLDLKHAVANFQIADAKAAVELIDLQKQTGLNMDSLNEYQKKQGFVYLIEQKISPDAWEHLFTTFPDMREFLSAHFQEKRNSYDHTLPEEVIEKIESLPEAHRRKIDPKLNGEILAHKLTRAYKTKTEEPFETMTQADIDWGSVASKFLNLNRHTDWGNPTPPPNTQGGFSGSEGFRGFGAFSVEKPPGPLKQPEAQKPKGDFPEFVQKHLEQHREEVFKTIFTQVLDRGILPILPHKILHLETLIGSPDMQLLTESLIRHVEETTKDLTNERKSGRIFCLIDLFDGFPESYQQALDKKVSAAFGRTDIMRMALEQNNLRIFKKLERAVNENGETEKINWDEIFSPLDDDAQNKLLFRILDQTTKISEQMRSDLKPFYEQHKNALLTPQFMQHHAAKSKFETLGQFVSYTQGDFDAIIAILAGQNAFDPIQSLITDYANNEKKSMMHQAIEKEKDRLFAEAFVANDISFINFLEAHVAKPDWKHVGSTISTRMNIVSLAQFSYTTFPELKQHVPWSASMEQLVKTQQIAKRAEHCPWQNELIPLSAAAIEKGILSKERAEDGELFVSFVRDFGAYKIPKIFELFVAIKRTERVEGLSEQHKKWLSECLGERAIAKAQNPEALLNSLRKFQREIQTQTLSDRIPDGMETELGQEVFTAMRGSTRWGRENELGGLIKTWKETQQKKPEVAKLKEGYTEKSFEIATVGDSILSTEEQDAQRNKLMDNRELQITMHRVLDTYRNGMNIIDIKTWWTEKQGAVLDKWKLDLDKTRTRQEQATSEVAKISMQKNIDRLQKHIDDLRAIQAPDTADEPTIVDFLESLARAKKEELGSALQELSAMHMNQVAIGNWSQQMRDVTGTANTVNPNSVERVGEFLTQYVGEHYLNADQENHDHTQHTPFSPELTDALKASWQVKGDVKKHPVMQTTEKLHTVDKGEVLQKKTPVAFVPAKGLMRIFAGDIGDACYTSRYNELADGQHENLTSVLMVTNRNGAEERMEGSVLFIEATTPKGESVLVVRANNPRENLLGKVDPNSLIEATLAYAKEIAKTRNIKKVAVIRDAASNASSNRGAVSDYYKTRFPNAPSLTLNNTPETNFNGYNIWNPESGHPAVEI